MTNEPPVSTGPRDSFVKFAATLRPNCTVLEAGTKRSVKEKPTHSRAWFPNTPREKYVMIDIFEGEDVDIVADLHKLPPDWTDKFDAFVAGAVFEHLERPWIAAQEVARVLAPGGGCYITTHQTFPLHGYPSDYFRFSAEALSLIFRDAGLEIIDVSYLHRSKIVPPENILPAANIEYWNCQWPSYIIVHLFARKKQVLKS